MPAFNLGYLLRAANTSLAAARQGTREREELDYRNAFNEWAKQNQMDFQRDQLSESSRLRDATNANTRAYNEGRLADQDRDDKTKREMTQFVQDQLNSRFGRTGQNVQDNTGEYVNIPRNVQGPTGVVAPLPESRDGVGAAPRQPAPRRLPVGEVEKIAGVNGVLEIAANAKRQLEGMIAKKQNVSGPITGPTAWIAEKVGMASPEAISLRASLANIGSREMLERSGAAVTPSEYERLRPFIPSKNDTEEVLLTKLDGFMREVKIIHEHRLSGLEDADYDMTKFRAREGSGTVDPDEALAQKFLSNRKKP